jgi:3'-5' exoribonuclease
MPPLEAPVEMVRKVYVAELGDKQTVHTVFKVGQKQKLMARNGKAFLSLSFVDKTGEMDARVFDRADEWDPTFAIGDFVLVNGHVTRFHGKLQVVVDQLERLDPEPIDPTEFAFSAPKAPAAQAPRASEDSSGPVTQIRELVDQVEDPHVKSLLLAFLNDPELEHGLKVAPAAKGIHHAYKGGLADHLLSVMRLAQRMADHYPMADRDLLLAGALLHDICKVKELSYEKGFDYTDEGRLVGHLVMTAQKIREKASQIPGFPSLLEHHITHLVLAHHGQLEYGSPKVPMTLEALIVHSIDMLDSRVASWLEAMAKDPNDKWTEMVRPHERHLWKGRLPTVRNKGPLEGRRHREGDRRRGGGGEHRRKDASGPKESGGPKLAFKPLNELAPNSSTEETVKPGQH